MVIDAVKEVGGPSFFALLVIAVSFLPVLTLEAQEGRLFKPLAYTKNFAMIVAAVLAITLDPAMRLLFTRMQQLRVPAALAGARSRTPSWSGTIHSGGDAPDQPRPDPRVRAGRARWSLRWKWVGASPAPWRSSSLTVPVYQRLGSEFMPPLDEGTLLYMPSTLPGISVDRGAAAAAGAGPDPQAVPRSRARARQGRPRGDLHRSGAALDDGDRHRPEAARRSGGSVDTWYSAWAPEWLKPLLRRITPDRISHRAARATR